MEPYSTEWSSCNAGIKAMRAGECNGEEMIYVFRLSKVALVAAVALTTSIVAFGNLTDARIGPL